MTGIFDRMAVALMKRRSSLPGWANRAMESVARNPDGILARLAGRLMSEDPVAATSIPDSPLRMYVAPTNYSGQGYAWARAVEREDRGIGARNAAVELPGGYGFRADTRVPIGLVNNSSAWADAEWDAVRRFTHVLIEAERSIFGRRFGRDLRSEIAALETEGVSVAFLCHGTDIRDPDAHAARTPWSLYPEDPRTDVLRRDARENLRLLTEMRRPTFVSTPDLLDDVPWARWCPVVVDPSAFTTARQPFQDPAVHVMHVPSAPLQKGTHLIQPAMERLLSERGDIECSLISSVPAAEMPRVYESSDVVLDQFRAGSYGVAACEAMAAGRVVVGHILPSVRERVLADHGLELPIVEATPDTLAEVLSGLAEDRDRAQRIASAGPEFVSQVHDGRASARVLIDGWLRASTR